MQVKDEDGEEAEAVMWCVDRIYETDVEYVRVGEREERLVKEG